MAKREDEWEDLLEEATGFGEPEHDPTWDEAVLEGIEEVRTLLRREFEKNQAMAEKMQAIIDQEIELKEEEDRQARERRRLKREVERGEFSEGSKARALDGR